MDIGGRAADDVEHLAGRGLVFERFLEVARARLQFGEQPRILHRDDRLVGKGAHQFDLPLGEQLDPLPVEGDRAQHGPRAQERYSKGGTSPRRHSLWHREVRVGADVLDLHDPAFERHPPDETTATGSKSSLAGERPMIGFYSVVGHSAVDLALAYPDRRGIVAAKSGSRFGDCVQHRLHIGGRSADDVEHVAGRGLIFERFFEVAGAGLQFAQQPRVLHRDDRLVGEGAHQFDLLLGEWLDARPRDIDRADNGSLAQQRHSEDGTLPGRRNLRQRVVRVSEDVRDMHDLAFERHAPGDAVAAGDKGSLAQDRPYLGVQCRG